ncbi:MAG TPA: acetylhydrolase [bacterium]|nr:acetylhydrolase [bacterium]
MSRARFLTPALVLAAGLLVPPGAGAQDAVIATSDRSGVIGSLVLEDPSRHRRVPLTVYYPVGQGRWPFPVIVFSHGAGGSKDGYAYLGRYWASHGYVVIHPTHFGSDASLLRRHRPFYNLRAIKKMVTTPRNFIDRPQDISFVLDHLAQVEGMDPELDGLFDLKRVGVAGHSFGAYTTLAVAGAVVSLKGQKPRSFRDPRPLAFIALSPQGDEPGVFEGNAWAGIRRPFLVMTGTEDKGLGGQPASWRQQPYGGMPPTGNKDQIVITGADHMNFAGVGLNGKVRDGAKNEYIQKATLTFWDAYLKGDLTAQRDVQSGYFPKVDGVEAAVQEK